MNWPQKARELLALRQIQLEEERINREVGGCSGSEDAPDQNWKYLAALLGMPVELDAPECRRLPLVTWGIALICILVFALTFPHLRETRQRMGFYPCGVDPQMRIDSPDFDVSSRRSLASDRQSLFSADFR